MTDTAGRIGRFLQEHDYSIEPPPVPARLFATRHGRGLGPFFPYIDYLFVHELDDEAARAPGAYEALHQRDRAWADTRFRLPRVMRYRIPVVVTIGVSDSGFSAETIAFAESSKQRDPAVGGEKHATYLFDAAAAVVYGQGIEATPVKGGGYISGDVNPANRIHRLVRDLVREQLPGWEIETGGGRDSLRNAAS